MRVHVVDGTYELFRHFYGAPRRTTPQGFEVGAVHGVVSSILALLRGGATHVGVATDHVIESFRNRMWPGYKRGEGIDPELLAQFHPLEEALTALGVVVWPMIEYEADDAMASVAAALVTDPEVEQVLLCSPDKDLAQCVLGDRIVQFDRRARRLRDAAAIEARYGVPPASIPDWLALVGDSSDGFPGVRGWGAKTASAVLARYRFLENIPQQGDWEVAVRGAARLAESLRQQWSEALLFRDLATLRTDAVRIASAESLRWCGPTPRFEAVCAELGAEGLAAQARELAETRAKESA